MPAQSDGLLRDEAEVQREARRSPSESTRNRPELVGTTTRKTHHDPDTEQQLNALAEAASGRRFSDQGIYFAERDGLVKIGRSRCVSNRMVGLSERRKRPVRLLAVGVCREYPVDVEIIVHNQFAGDHLGHEWFRPSARLLTFIRQVARTRRIPARLDKRVYDFVPRPQKLTGRGRRKYPVLHWTHRRTLRRAAEIIIAAELARRAVPSYATPLREMTQGVRQ